MDEERVLAGVAAAEPPRMRWQERHERLERARTVPPEELARVLVDAAVVLMAVRRAVAPGRGPLPPDAPFAA